MFTDKTYESDTSFSLISKLKDYAVFAKFRLSVLVVVSAISGFLLAGFTSYYHLILMSFGGMLVTAASNGFNQIIERNLDKLMTRTEKRPLPQGNMSKIEGIIVASFFGFVGIILLAQINFKTALLGFFALFLYVAIYTPLKRITPWSVFVGAFPGALPPMIGVVAATNEYSFMAGILFLIQFIWQFPHFWAIAWVMHEDYQKAGFSLLPSSGGKNKITAFQIMLYTLIMIPVSLLPWILDWTGDWTLYIGALLGMFFFYYAYKLYFDLSDKTAKKLMFASFLYLPLIQFLYVLDKV